MGSSRSGAQAALDDQYCHVSCNGKVPELAMHVQGAVNNGVSATEIRKVLVQVCIYCGIPAGMDGFKAAEKVLIDMKAEGANVLP